MSGLEFYVNFAAVLAESGQEVGPDLAGRSGSSVGGGRKGLQTVENIGNRSESNSHSGIPLESLIQPPKERHV